MAQSRRDLLKTSAAVAAPYLLSKSARAAEIFAAAEPVRYFEGKGYELLPPHGLITDYSFNGGIRYDELPTPNAAEKTIRLQGCARLEDIPRRGEPGVLPKFHILGYHNPEPAFPARCFIRSSTSWSTDPGSTRTGWCWFRPTGSSPCAFTSTTSISGPIRS